MKEVKKMESFVYDDVKRKELKRSIANFAEVAVSLIAEVE